MEGYHVFVNVFKVVCCRIVVCGKGLTFNEREAFNHDLDGYDMTFDIILSGPRYNNNFLTHTCMYVSYLQIEFGWNQLNLTENNEQKRFLF